MTMDTGNKQQPLHHKYTILGEIGIMELSGDQEKQITAFIEALNKLCSGERDTCLHCNTIFSELQQVGRCVYAYPCGHRQYQGTLPERWKPKKKIHPYLLEQLQQENE